MPAAAQAKTTITLSGSTSVAPLATQARQGLREDAGPGKVKFRILQGGSDIGIADVSRGRVTLGMSSRDPQPSDPGGLVFNRIARDGVCIATNPEPDREPLPGPGPGDLLRPRPQLEPRCPGAKASGPIDLIVRNAASGTQDAFQNIFMGQDLRVSPSASQRPSNGRVQQAIALEPERDRLRRFNFTEGLHTVPYKGVACTLRNAKSGQYGGVRNFWLVTRGKATGAAAPWIKWIERSSKARKIIATNWVPLEVVDGERR